MSEAQGRPRFLTVNEVADLMRVSRMTVYRLVHSGELPAVRVGRSFRVPQDALDAYLRSSTTVEPTGGERRSS
ncbi:helix-turn-helix domain-containing protein [Cellulomonas oligotrophica]|uniref:Excisionase n=1 Tax=Cellulomonas oligotrophica TaxID=931536 RepID=A0A7Y9FE90_9CELL|nr:helix-turn-helix domain-containing protein [Cellulomonas oligotrophica]NYD85604.1 excisionase family DNA binding protein [Cellulomonas oligotrophica]GIG31387.1 excisionase [Cellulomonas oligotrophica]